MEFRHMARLLTSRGWGFVAAGAAGMLAAQVLGRRDLLVLGVFLLLLPLLAALSLRLLKPLFEVERSFRPASVEAGIPVTVTLSLRSRQPLGQSAVMREGLPLRFGESPVFRFPARRPAVDGTSTYEYQLRSARRGLFAIGPVSAEFQDLFGLAQVMHSLGGTDPLVVAPVPLELPGGITGGPPGTDGSVASRRRGAPSEDDATTREYRAGDPMRRVHWAATARHGELMVRQEEPVTSPSATLLLDARQTGYAGGTGTVWEPGGVALETSESFEWAVTAAVSVAAHLVENGYSVHMLDPSARPALERSPSAPYPGERNFTGDGGLQNLAEGLAALGLEPSTAPAASPAEMPGAGRREAAAARLRWGGPASRTGTDPSADSGAVRGAFGDALLDSLLQRRRGPLVAVLGKLSGEDAQRLAPAADFASSAHAFLVVDRPRDAGAAVSVLRAAGWEAVAISPETPVPLAWASFASAAPAGIPAGTGREERT